MIRLHTSPNSSADEPPMPGRNTPRDSRETLLREDAMAIVSELYALAEAKGDRREWECPGCDVVRRIRQAEADEQGLSCVG